jgi:hypothetical protein
MIATRRSDARQTNRKMSATARRRGEGNIPWLKRHLRTWPQWNTFVLLVGGSDLTSFRLRAAQAHARRDLLPSFWSHVALLRRSQGEWILWEVSLQPAGGFGCAAQENGIQQGALEAYGDPAEFPNMACLRFACGEADIGASLERFRSDRSSVDVPALVVDWLAYCWGVGDRGNPLLRGAGIPSAVFVEAVFALAGVEVTPGLSSPASCPEAIWQAGRWWHEFYESEAVVAREAPLGCYVIGQPAAAVRE